MLELNAENDIEEVYNNICAELKLGPSPREVKSQTETPESMTPVKSVFKDARDMMKVTDSQ